MSVASTAPCKKQRPGRKTPVRIILGLLTVPLLGAVTFLGYIGLFTGNVRTVVPGRVYRSAQLSSADLSQLIQAKGIRTVLSLRGGEESDRWYRQEAEACRRSGTTLEVLHLRATALPPPKELRELLTLFDRSEYPLLFHCRGGADRSGLAAVLYLNVYEGIPLETALAQELTWRYGHFKLHAGAMDRFFELFRKDADRYDLRTWILQQYPSVYLEARIRRRRRSPLGGSGSSVQTNDGERALRHGVWMKSALPGTGRIGHRLPGEAEP